MEHRLLGRSGVHVGALALGVAASPFSVARARATKPKILVIGGGIGGMVAAIGLVRKGFDVEVHEQTHDIFVRDGDDLHCTVSVPMTDRPRR